MRNATAVDIVRRLTGTPYRQTSEASTALGWGMGNAQLHIREAVDEAIELGWVKVVSVRQASYAGTCRFLALTDGTSYCRTCIVGCDHDQEKESCAHLGCWGPNPTKDCAGIPFAKVAVLNRDEWAELDDLAALAAA